MTAFTRNRAQLSRTLTALAEAVRTTPDKDLPALKHRLDAAADNFRKVIAASDNARELVLARLHRDDLRPATLRSLVPFLDDVDLRAILVWCDDHEHHLRSPDLHRIASAELELRHVAG